MYLYDLMYTSHAIKEACAVYELGGECSVHFSFLRSYEHHACPSPYISLADFKPPDVQRLTVDVVLSTQWYEVA